MKKKILFLGVLASLSWNTMSMDLNVLQGFENHAYRITQNKDSIEENKENIGENTSSITTINKELDDHKVAAAQRDKLIDQGRRAQLVTSQHIIGIKVNEHAVSSNVIDKTNKLLGNEEVEGVALKDYIQINDPYSGNPAMAKHHEAEMQAVDKTYEVISKNKENSETALATAKENTTKIANNNEKIASNIADIGKNTSSITAINKELDDHKIESDKAIAQLKEQDKLLKATDAKVNTAIDNLKETDKNLQTTDTKLAQTDKELKGAITTLEEHHDAVYETIGTTRGANTKDIKVVKADINRDRIIALEDQTKSVETNEAEISNNTKNIEGNKANISKNTKNIVTNTEKIEYNGRSISDNSERIGSLEGKVDGLETEMKKGFAMAAAMSSIDFQVLDVGDAGFGFGVGNYKNSDAVSLGVGVRPTENMTLNVKGAMSTGKGQETMVGGGAVYKFNLFGS